VTAPGIAAARRGAVAAASYAASALALGWFVGGQAALGRVDASLAVPLLMPGALLFARLARTTRIPKATVSPSEDEGHGRAKSRPRRCGFSLRSNRPLDFARGNGSDMARSAAAILLLFAAQAALHLSAAGRFGLDHLLLTALAGVPALWVASAIERWTRAWRRRLRWPVFALAVAGWFVLGQAALALVHRDRAAAPTPQVVMLTSLPLRWSGGGGDLADMLAAGPADLPALAAIEEAVDLRLVDTLESGVPRGAVLFLAHPRALPPRDLVRIDDHLRGGGRAVILADALSSWPPVHALGDARNPPVTSLLTPLLDHMGIELAAPTGADEGEARLFLDPGGTMLRLHSAGRFVRLPASCRAFGGARAARCAIGGGTLWIVGDADLLHADLWQSPVAWAPWLRRSDNMAWLIDVLTGRETRGFRPLWTGSRGE
jgi:hypothetical protein